MPKITLRVGEEQQRPMGARWLSIVNANTAFKIEGEFGSLVGEVGRVFDMDGFNQITFKNDTSEQIEFEYETSNVKVYAVGKGVVSIANAVEVTRIKEAIQVNANATVENGKMAILPSNIFESIAVNKAVIAPGVTREIFPERNAENRNVLIQVITDTGDTGNFTAVRVGTSAANVDTGIFLSGNKNAPASVNFENIASSIFVKNESDVSVTLAGGEQWRA
jgi:hypothetical protein